MTLLMILCTLPVAFSSTRMSFVPMKAMLVGWLRPTATFRTARFGSTTDGGTRGSCAIAGRTRATARNATPTRAWSTFLRDSGAAAALISLGLGEITPVFWRLFCIEPPYGSRLGRRLPVPDALAAFDWRQ